MRVRRRQARLRKETGWRAGLELFAALAILGGIITAPILYAERHLSEGQGHRQLAAVAVDPRACPGLRAIESAASEFENTFYSSEVRTAPWSTSKVKVGRALADLEQALTADIPALPTKIRSSLSLVVADVRRGRDIVSSAHDFSGVINSGANELNRASSSYGDASALVGDACGSIYAAPSTPPSRALARVFAGIADWVCGPQRKHCPNETRSPTSRVTRPGGPS